MCRWIAYLGPSIPMSLLLVEPQNSLLVQAVNAKEGAETTNGDGFGVGWYTGLHEEPGLYREVRPAWNDDNLRDLSRHIRSGMFLAHIRAATGTAVQRSNCHPFQHRRWLFQHNGHIPEFPRVRRQLMMDVDPALFDGIQGTADSEVLFHLALSFGLDHDPPGALARTIGHVERRLDEAGIEREIQFSAAVADGESLYAVRYSSRGTPRTLYYSRDVEVLDKFYPETETPPPGSILVVSEPLGSAARWTAVPESSLIVANNCEVDLLPFEPA
jgi:predicted glutamine amidotransferase